MCPFPRSVLAAVLLIPLAVLPVACGGSAPPGAAASERVASAAQTRWPVASSVAADRLQREVDAGHQPWLLDPESVATSYAAAVLGWPRVQTSRSGRTVVVHQVGGTGREALTLAQPVRGGPGGIWVVTHADPPPPSPAPSSTR